jgi:Fur family ferric uptake transcriptional regulator
MSARYGVSQFGGFSRSRSIDPQPVSAAITRAQARRVEKRQALLCIRNDPITIRLGSKCHYDSRMVNPDVLAAGIKSTGLKVTVPRVKVLSIFESSKVRHLSAEDVYKLMLAEDMDIGLATVYRVLTQFEQAGILLRSNFESGKAVFELNEGSHHDHLVCLDCGRVEEFFDEKIEDRQKKIAEEKGFQLQEHALALYGHCTKRNCAHKPKKG